MKFKTNEDGEIFGRFDDQEKWWQLVWVQPEIIEKSYGSQVTIASRSMVLKALQKLHEQESPMILVSKLSEVEP